MRGKNIGLLFIKDEEDVLKEVMDNNAQYFEEILVLDGSETDACIRILDNYPNIKFYGTDEGNGQSGYKREIKDHFRQVLLNKARELYGTGNWITLLHGDEIFNDNPNHVIEEAESQNADCIRWHALQYFPHRSNMDAYFHDPQWKEKTVTEKFKHHCKGFFEDRQFFDDGTISYPGEEGNPVRPKGLKGVFPHFPGEIWPSYRHYTYRSPEQLTRRIQTNRTWQPCDYQFFFPECLMGFKVVSKDE